MSIETDDEYARAWANRGMALRQIGDRDGALYSFQKAALLDPDDKNSRQMIEKMGHRDYLDAIDDVDEIEDEDYIEDDLDWEE